jgi:CRISPR/Cas system CMR subunit Cmr6 (Cas7 group RAMP superfamily)
MILWDSVVVDRKSLETAIINAGTLVGVGDGRQSIGYGRFDVTEFSIV